MMCFECYYYLWGSCRNMCKNLAENRKADECIRVDAESPVCDHFVDVDEVM